MEVNVLALEIFFQPATFSHPLLFNLYFSKIISIVALMCHPAVTYCSYVPKIANIK